MYVLRYSIYVLRYSMYVLRYSMYVLRYSICVKVLYTSISQLQLYEALSY
jgi:hypothetical protein